MFCHFVTIPLIIYTIRSRVSVGYWRLKGWHLLTRAFKIVCIRTKGYIKRVWIWSQHVIMLGELIRNEDKVKARYRLCVREKIWYLDYYHYKVCEFCSLKGNIANHTKYMWWVYEYLCHLFFHYITLAWFFLRSYY